jgi:hypothetical protein
MATINTTTKLEALELEKVGLETKIKELVIKRTDVKSRLELAIKRVSDIDIIIKELNG